MNLMKILQEGVRLNASDLHLCVGSPPMARVYGDLLPIRGYDAFKDTDLRNAIYSILGEEERKYFEENWELDKALEIPSLCRFRVNLYRDMKGIAGAFRIISFKIRSLKDLNLPNVFGDLSRQKMGLILVTGPTGSGKSTTLAALINEINMNRKAHILTLEDPIEYVHPNIKSIVNQREVGLTTRSFADGLKYALREDPDVILVGEMRDLETIQNALRAAETGHLVLSTLHTNSAASAVERIVDIFPDHQQKQIRLQLANTLGAVVYHQLLKKKDGRGYIPVLEILIGTSGIKNLIRENKLHQIGSLIQTGGKFRMQTFDDALLKAYNKNLITEEQALENARNFEAMKNRLSTVGVKERSERRWR